MSEKLPKTPKTWSQLIEYRKKKVHTQKLVNYEDKVKSKEIAQKSGCPVPKNYWIGSSAFSIPFKKLPKRYVAKPSHYASSKGVFLMNHGKNMFNGEKVKKNEMIQTLQKILSIRITPKANEWATSKIPRRIIIEEFLPNLEGKYDVPTDYKCYVFHGKVCMVRVDYDRLSDKQSVDYFNREFQLITFDPVRTKHLHKTKSSDPIPLKPAGYDLMIEYVEKMGEKFGSFIRIDMYLTPDGPYFGEFTVYPGSGAGSLFTEKTDRYMGALWQNSELVLGENQKPFTSLHFDYVLNSI